MVVKYTGIAGKRGYNPTKIVLHNDDGSKNGTAAFYKSWLDGRKPELGFAHYYVCSDGTYQAEYDYNCAWHAGKYYANRDYIGIEICQSRGDEKVFRSNEQKAFKLAAQLCKKYGIAVTVDNFPLHKEITSTDCPARSVALHGPSNAAVKKYYVEQVKKYMGDSGSTAEPEKPSVAQLTVDGYWGPSTTKRLQQYFNCKSQDGVISGQIKGRWNQAIPSIQFGKGGSMVVIALQKWLGIEQDGNLGPATVKALQKKLGTSQDGVISAPSAAVMELQRRLNKNKL